MIIAFDGNVYTGKTTLIKALSKKIHANIVSEYSEYFNEAKKQSKKRMDHLKIQLEYLKLDQKRRTSLSSKQMNLLDRSFISLFAHVWATYNAGIDIRRETLKEFAIFLKRNKIIIPTIYVDVYSPLDIVKERLSQNKKLRILKNTADYLIEEDYFNSIQIFNERIFRLLPSLRINTASSLSKNVNELTRFLNSLPELHTTKAELLKKITSVLLMKKSDYSTYSGQFLHQ